MPIRTNRGRAAVYRRLWAWPLRSPRHLAGAVLLFAVLATVIGFVMPDGANPLTGQRTGSGSTGGYPVITGNTTVPPTAASGESPTGADDQRGTSRPSASTGSSRRGPITTTPPEPAEVDPDALAVASAWASAWVTHPDGMTNEQWTAQLAPFTTEEFLPQLASVDPANIPSTEVTGQPKPSRSTTSAVEVDVPTDGATLHLTLVSTPNGWQIAAYDRSE